MSVNGGPAEEMEVSPAIFSELSAVEREFAGVELDALRRKEYNLIPLYQKRTSILEKIPSFWPQVLFNGPQEFQSVLNLESVSAKADETTIDFQTIAVIKSLHIERYGIKSETEGEPRSLRFTFEFNKNAIFEDEKVVKEFQYITPSSDDDSGALISTPVTFKWTKAGKKQVAKCGGLLDLAVELYQAEEAAKMSVKGVKGGKGEEVDMVDREELWQYEKLREKLEKLQDGEEVDGCWLDWFGYRGPVDMNKPTASKPEKKNGTENGNGTKKEKDCTSDCGSNCDEDCHSEDDEDAGLLDVEIFPSGEEVAIALADDLWPNVMDYFMASQDSDNEEEFEDMDVSDEDEDAPELVNVEEINVEEILDTRPPKKLRTK